MKNEAVIEYKRFSLLNKLLRVVVYVLRFAHNLKREREGRIVGQVRVKEMDEAKTVIIKLIQNEKFTRNKGTKERQRSSSDFQINHTPSVLGRQEDIACWREIKAFHML